MHSAPIIFQKKDYIIASYFFGLPTKVLKKLQVIPVNEEEFSFISTKTEKINGSMAKMGDNYYYNIGNRVQANYELLVLAYSLSNPTDTDVVASQLKEIRRFYEMQGELERRINNEILEYEANHPTPLPIKMFSFDEFKKICRKYKVGCEKTDSGLVLIFPKVRIGSNVEGYVNYKKIEIHFNMNFKIKKFVFHFNGFYIDSSWSLGMNFHPHLSGANRFCMGNQAEDYRMSRDLQDYDLMVGILKSVITTYTPESPYTALSNVITAIRGIEKYAKEIFGDEVTDAERYRFLQKSVPKCPVCCFYLDEDGKCKMNNCKANENAEIRCPECGSLCERGEFDRISYKWICKNTQCPASPDFRHIAISALRYCRVCGENHFGPIHNYNKQWREFDKDGIKMYSAILLEDEDIVRDITEIPYLGRRWTFLRKQEVSSLLIERDGIPFPPRTVQLNHELGKRNADGSVTFFCAQCNGELTPSNDVSPVWRNYCCENSYVIYREHEKLNDVYDMWDFVSETFKRVKLTDFIRAYTPESSTTENNTTERNE